MTNDWQLNHIGMVVQKKNRILHDFHSKGIGVSVGPQPLLPHMAGETELLIYRTLDGDPIISKSEGQGAHTFYDGEIQIGTAQLECIQPGPGNFIGAYLESKGEGINHLCFNVSDVGAETTRLLGKGCELMFSAKTGGQIVENYLDTRKFGDVIISFRPPAGEWERAWKAHNEAHPLVNDWTFRGLGIAVHDIAQTAAFYEDLGFAARTPSELDSTLCDEFTVNGKPADQRVRARSRGVEVGPVIFDFIEPLEGEAVFQDALARRGEGIFSLDFVVADLEGEVARLEGKGLVVVMRSRPRDAAAFAYIDTREVGNTMIKLVAEG